MSRNRSIRTSWIVWTIAAAGLVVGACQASKDKAPPPMAATAADHAPAKDEAASRKAFLAAYPVFMHARCMNCHPAGDAPLQGEDSRVHMQNVKRGVDGRGVNAMRCANCHQVGNTPGANMPPGNPNWRLPPANMKMVFQGKSPSELATQLKDPAQNGGMSLERLLHHITEDSLVLGGWDPGEGRSKPPMSHDDFVRNVKAWIEQGAAIP